MNLRIATWNLQAVFEVESDPAVKWRWLQEQVRPDVALLTEAKAPPPGVPFTVFRREEGLGSGRRWGSAVAIGPELRCEEVITAGRRLPVDRSRPGATVVVDVLDGDDRLLTAVCVYADTRDRDGAKVGSGRKSLPELVRDLKPLFRERRSTRIVVGGDLNLWPSDARRWLRRLPLVDLVELTADERPANTSCVCADPKPCGHVWTHANKANPTKVQQIDYLLATPDLAACLVSLTGGPADFPGVWDLSDHAPLVAGFDLDVLDDVPRGRFRGRLARWADRIDPESA